MKIEELLDRVNGTGQYCWNTFSTALFEKRGRLNLLRENTREYPGSEDLKTKISFVLNSSTYLPIYFLTGKRKNEI